uniref:DUF3108 domain-containing protein n=1 Tax=candidate division WOR-3 bacterium TaxID=2052148 RepID=A0A7V0Z4C6_UNCW3
MKDIFLNHERTIYSIKFLEDTKGTIEIGRLTTIFKKDNNIEVVNETIIYPQNIKENTLVYLSKLDFRPLRYESYITTPYKDITIKGEYHKKNVIATISTTQETKKIRIDITNDNTYDNASAFYIFRLIACGILPIKRLYLINLNIGQKILIEVEPIEETVKCMFGEIDCLGVRMRLCEHSQSPAQKFFYRKESPNYLIKNIAGRQVLEIEQIGDVDGSH